MPFYFLQRHLKLKLTPNINTKSSGAPCSAQGKLDSTVWTVNEDAEVRPQESLFCYFFANYCKLASSNTSCLEAFSDCL